MPFGMSAFILIDDMTLREWTHYISNTPAIVKTSLMEESASHQATVALLAAKSAKKQQLADQESEHETVDVGGGGGRLLLLEDNSSTKNKKRNRPSRIVTTTSNDPNNNGGKQRTTTRRRTGDDYSNGHNHHSNPHLQSNSIPSSGGSEITTFEQFDIAQALSAPSPSPVTVAEGTLWKCMTCPVAVSNDFMTTVSIRFFFFHPMHIYIHRYYPTIMPSNALLVTMFCFPYVRNSIEL